MRAFMFAGVLAMLTGAGPAPTAAAQSLPEGVDETFTATSLNPVLAIGADAVVRLDDRRFEVKTPGTAVTHVRKVVTILNAGGRNAGTLVVNYDEQLRKLKKFDGRIRSADGKVVRSLRKDDEEDYSAISGISLYDANRVRVGRLVHDVYPYTVEYEYEIEHDGLINWPTWYPLGSDLPVEFGRLEVDVPEGTPVRYRATGVEITPDVLVDGSRSTYRWQVESLPALASEPYGPPWVHQTIAVHTAPADFEVEDAAGSMESWGAFAAWYAGLSKGRHYLPAGAHEDIRALIEGVDGTREKARLIYEYMQKRTRYVSIQLGLGGWQPFNATSVHENGYGDCKALTNYLYALLKLADIESYPALIRGGRGAAEILPEFPSNQFNHVVLAVPAGADTLWLEATSQTLPFNHLGTFTEDRHALLVRPDGGELVRTPSSRAEWNQKTVNAEIRVTAGGGGFADVRTHYTGNQLDHVRNQIVNRSQTDQDNWLHSFVDAANSKLVDVDLAEIEAGGADASISLELELPRYAARAGSRLLLPVNAMQRWTNVPEPAENRSQPVRFFAYPFVDTDTVRFQLPAGYTVMSVPEPVEFATDFGEYHAEVLQPERGVIEYRRRLNISKIVLPAEQYDAFRQFALEVSQADRNVVLLAAD